MITQKQPISRQRRREIGLERLRQKRRLQAINLPEDSVFHILSFLTFQDTYRMRRVSHVWHKIVSEKQILLLQDHKGIAMCGDWPDDILYMLHSILLDSQIHFHWIEVYHVHSNFQWRLIFYWCKSLKWIRIVNSSRSFIAPLQLHFHLSNIGTIPSNIPPDPTITNTTQTNTTQTNTTQTNTTHTNTTHTNTTHTTTIIPNIIVTDNTETQEIWNEDNTGHQRTLIHGEGLLSTNPELDLSECEYIQIVNSSDFIRLFDIEYPLQNLQELDISFTTNNVSNFNFQRYLCKLQAPHLKKLQIKKGGYIVGGLLSNLQNVEEVSLLGSSPSNSITFPSTLRELNLNAPQGYISCNINNLSGLESIVKLNMEGNTSIKRFIDLIEILRPCHRLNWINFRHCFVIEQSFLLKELFLSCRALQRVICNTGDFIRRDSIAEDKKHTLEEWYEHDYELLLKLRFTVRHLNNNPSTYSFIETK